LLGEWKKVMKKENASRVEVRGAKQEMSEKIYRIASRQNTLMCNDCMQK